MKKLLTNLFAAVMLAGAFATACTEEETGNAEPSFPTTEFNEVLVGPEAAAGDETLTDEYEIKFTPNYDWTLSVSMENNRYFRLIDNGQERFSVNGPASETEISVVAKCVAEADFEEHSTDVYLTMNGIEQKIGRLTIAGNTVVFEVFPAVTEDGAFVPATDGTYTYKYAETAASSETQIPMIWNPVNSRYETFVLVHSNLAWNITATSDQNNITYERLTEGTNPLYTELQVACLLRNNDAETKTYTFTATIQDETVPEEDRSKTFTISTPQFVPELSVYLASVTNGSLDYPETSGTGLRYAYETEPLAEGGDITMFWPEGLVGFFHYITVDSNFNFGTYTLTDEDGTAKPVDWLSISKIVTESEDGEVTESTITEYELKGVSTAYPLDGDDVYINFTESSSDKTFRYRIVFPECRNYLKSDGIEQGATLIFNADGQYYNQSGLDGGYYVDGGATTRITSAEGLVIVELVKVGDWLYTDGYSDTDWISSTYSWDSSSNDKIQSNELTITVSASTESREGVVLAFPAEIHQEVIDKLADQNMGTPPYDYSYVLSSDGKTVDAAYEDYIVAYVSQEGPSTEEAEFIEPEEPDSWNMLGADFKVLTESDSDYMMANGIYGTDKNYTITYATPEACTYTAIRIEQDFTSLKIYNSNYMTAETEYARTFTNEGGYDHWVLGEPSVQYWMGFSQYSGSRYAITMDMDAKPEGAKDQSFYVFYNEDVAVATLIINYDPDAEFNPGGGDEEIVPEFQYPEYAGSFDGSTLEEVQEDDPLMEYYNGVPLYHVTFISESHTMSQLVISGQITNMMIAPLDESWLTCEASEENVVIGTNASAAFADYTADQARTRTGCIRFYSGSEEVLTLVVTLDMTAAAE